MDSLITWLGIGSAALLVVATLVAWWEHRVRMAALRRELALAEDSRFALEEHVRGVDVRLQAMDAALESQKEALASARDAASHKSSADSTLQRIVAGSAPTFAAPESNGRPSVWPDTLPMVQATKTYPAYEPTQPVDLHPH